MTRSGCVIRMPPTSKDEALPEAMRVVRDARLRPRSPRPHVSHIGNRGAFAQGGTLPGLASLFVHIRPTGVSMVATASFARAARRVLASLVIAAALAPASVGARATREQAATGARTDRPATGGAPAPLLERDLLFGAAEIPAPQTSPEGTHFGSLKAFKGRRRVGVKRADEPMAAAKPVTADPRRSV